MINKYNNFRFLILNYFKFNNADRILIKIKRIT